MRRTAGVAALVATTVIAAVGVAVASGSSGHDGTRHKKRVEVLRLQGVDVTGTVLDLDHSGGTPPSTVGDQVVGSADLFVRQRKVGFHGITCTLIRPPALFHCITTNSLPNGQLTVQGILDFAASGRHRMAITGGTNRYRDASGHVDVQPNTPGQGRFRATLHIRR